MLWLSNYKKFNDPFELKMLTIDRKGLKEQDGIQKR